MSNLFHPYPLPYYAATAIRPGESWGMGWYPDLATARRHARVALRRWDRVEIRRITEEHGDYAALWMETLTKDETITRAIE